MGAYFELPTATDELRLRWTHQIEALERSAKSIREHAAGKREFGWEDQARGLELALAIVEGQLQGLTDLMEWTEKKVSA